MTKPDALPAALARLREAKGLTRYALAKLAGTDEISLSRMERGERQPRLPVLCRLADALGCGLDELCGRSRPASGG